MIGTQLARQNEKQSSAAMAEPARTADGLPLEGSLHSVQAALRQMMGQASGTQLTDQAGFRSQLQALLSQLDSLGPSQNELQNDEGEAVIDIREGEDESNAMLLHPRASQPPSRQQRTAHSPIKTIEEQSSLQPGVSAHQSKQQSKEQSMLDDEIFARLDRLMEEEQAAGTSSEEDDDEEAADQQSQPSRPDSDSGPPMKLTQESSSAAAAPGLFMPAALSLDDESDEGVDILPAFLPAALSLSDDDDQNDHIAPAAGSNPSRPTALSETLVRDLQTDSSHHKTTATQPSHTTTAQPSSTPSNSSSRPLSSKPYSVLHINNTLATVPPPHTTIPSAHAPAVSKQHPPTTSDSTFAPVPLSQPPAQPDIPSSSLTAPPSRAAAPPLPQPTGISSTIITGASSSKGSSLRRGFFPASRATSKSPAVQQTASATQAVQAGKSDKPVSSSAPPTPASISSGRRVSFSSDCATESAEDKFPLPSSGGGSQPSSSKVMQAVAEQDASAFTGHVMEHSSRDRQVALASSDNSLPVLTGSLVRSGGSKGEAASDRKIGAADVAGDPNAAALPAASMSKFKQRRLGLA